MSRAPAAGLKLCLAIAPPITTCPAQSVTPRLLRWFAHHVSATSGEPSGQLLPRPVFTSSPPAVSVAVASASCAGVTLGAPAAAAEAALPAGSSRGPRTTPAAQHASASFSKLVASSSVWRFPTSSMASLTSAIACQTSSSERGLSRGARSAPTTNANSASYAKRLAALPESPAGDSTMQAAKSGPYTQGWPSTIPMLPCLYPTRPPSWLDSGWATRASCTA
mmetsp:Transcript_41889/g.97183  ORF Transcript_41889/g.97183 Transcript_41889/m.97183 type:complete len:222 (-) Transcript_41889:152-817(-)